MHRRALLASAAAAGAAALPRFAVAQPAQGRVLKFVPQANLTSLDPIWTTANVTRNHGYMVYDTLYGMDAEFRPQPQMAEGHTVEEDGRSCHHHPAPGPANSTTARRSGRRTAAQSLRRWMKRSPIGQKLETFTEELAALDDRRLRFRLKRPFPLLLHALGQISSSPPFIMPERVARTDPFQQIRETVGSGPFRFRSDEYNSGSLAAYERHRDYSPTPNGRPSLTAGPKLAHFDRVEWHMIADPATASAAIQSGEIDWIEQPPPEIKQLLGRNRRLLVEPIDPLPLHRHPAAQPPASALQRQADAPGAVAGGQPGRFHERGGRPGPGAHHRGRGRLHAGHAPRLRRRPWTRSRARAASNGHAALMQEAGYTNQPMRLIGPTDILAPAGMTQVGADLLRRLGFNADIVLTDWGTAVQRRTSREPVERGGWSMIFTAFSSFDLLDPSAHFPLRGNGLGGLARLADRPAPGGAARRMVRGARPAGAAPHRRGDAARRDG